MALGACTHLPRDCMPLANGWCASESAAAATSWQYAQLAHNSYNGRAGRATYALLEQYVERYNSPAEDGGFTYAIFDRLDAGHLRETIIAFRGTDSLSDWLHGNLSKRRNRQGRAIYALVREALDAHGYADVPVTVTGHSLGGAMASSVAREWPDVPAYVFNASPNYRHGDEFSPPWRLAVSENGEFLGLARLLSSESRANSVTLECFEYAGPSSRLRDHSSDLLAGCLTWIAARAQADGASQSLSVNRAITPPDTEPTGLPAPPGWLQPGE